MQDQPFFVTNGEMYELHIRDFCPQANRHFELTVFGPSCSEQEVKQRLSQMINKRSSNEQADV